jgi:hypothetical protein
MLIEVPAAGYAEVTVEWAYPKIIGGSPDEEAQQALMRLAQTRSKPNYARAKVKGVRHSWLSL